MAARVIRHRGRLRPARCLAAAAAILTAGGLLTWARSAAGGAAPGGSQDGPLVIKRSLWEWDPTGRRDPFIFREPETKKTPIPGGGKIWSSGKIPGTGAKEPVTPTQPGQEGDAAAQRQRAKEFAERLVDAAFEALGGREYGRAEEYAAVALEHVRIAGLEGSKLAERLTRLEKTAERLRKRAEVEERFRNLKIVIGGILWQPTRPVAVINGGVVEEGDTVLSARVEEIRQNEIIFSLDGVRVSKSRE